MGRPSSFTQEMADALCIRIGEGEPLRQVCRDEGMPEERTVYRWLEANETFRQEYARAREIMMDRFADEIIEIADDGSNDWMEREGKDGNTVTVLNDEHVRRSALRLDARKWLLSKCAPKKYGDKTQLVGDGGGPVNLSGTLTVTHVKPGAN